MDVAKMAQGGFKSKPAGLQGLEDADISRIAQANFKAKPAGLQGYEGEGFSQLIQKNSGVKPAGLQGYEGFDYTSDFAKQFETNHMRVIGPAPTPQQLSEKLSAQDISSMAVKNAGKAVAGSTLGNSDHDAFEGFGMSTEEEATSVVKKNAGVAPAGGIELSKGDWNSNFNAAAQALTQADMIFALRKAVASVPDNTPEATKKQYFHLAKQLMQRKAQTNIPSLDAQYVEIQSNLGWLIDPRVAKKGGFDAAVGAAVAKATAPIASKEQDHYDSQKLFADGDKLKTAVKKAGKLAGLDGAGGILTALVLLGASATVAFLAWKHFSKKPVSVKNREKRAK
jgi:hypothetical protein